MALFNDQGGGQALPPYLQGRTPTLAGTFATKPIITPKASVTPGEVNSAAFKPNVATPGYNPQNAPTITPATPRLPTQGAATITPYSGPMPVLKPATPGLNQGSGTLAAAGAGGDKPSIQTLFEFMKQDLENERNRALGATQASAANRGVYYGTPLTTSEGDINTSYLRGLGQLQANMLQNEQQNELSRLSLASGLISQPASYGELANTGASNPDVYQTIGSLFANKNAPTAPTITPAPTAAMAPGSGIQPKGITPPTSLVPQNVAPAFPQHNPMTPQAALQPATQPTIPQPMFPGITPNPAVPNTNAGITKTPINPLITLLKGRTVL